MTKQDREEFYKFVQDANDVDLLYLMASAIISRLGKLESPGVLRVLSERTTAELYNLATKN
jgi:hypothetical protein